MYPGFTLELPRIILTCATPDNKFFIFGKAPSPWIAENWKSDTQQSIIPRVPFDYTKHFGIKKG